MLTTLTLLPLYSSVVLLDKESVKQQVTQLESRFLQLAYCTYQTVKDKGINVDNFHAWLMLVNSNLSQRHEHEQFIDNLNIHEKTHLNDLWKRLCKYWNFLNFDLLEHIAIGFGSEDLKRKIKTYECDLQSFQKATKLRDFIECWPVKGQTPPETELREFVAKMNHDWDNCTLEDLEKLRGDIIRQFFLPEFALQLKQIKRGCFAIIWLIPAPFVKPLQNNVESTSSEFFVEKKIETIAIDGQVCYPAPTRKPADYLKEQYTSLSKAEPQQGEKASGDTLSEKHNFWIPEEETLILKEIHKERLAELTHSETSTRMTCSEKLQLLGRYPAYSQLDTPFSKHQRKLHTSETSMVYNFLTCQPVTSEEEISLEGIHERTLAEEIPSGDMKSMVPSEKIQLLGKHPAYTQPEIQSGKHKQKVGTSESGAIKPKSGYSDTIRPHTVEDKIQHFKKKFRTLVDKAYQEVKKYVKPSDFLSCVTCLQVSAPGQPKSFIEEELTDISPPVTFEKVWSIVNLYWNFLNYELLEHVIDTFGSEDLKQQMWDYVHELSTFKQTTQLFDFCDFIESWPGRANGPPNTSHKKVIVKMLQNWSQCTLKDVEMFKKILVDMLLLKKFDILLQKADRGAACITWLTSPSIATLLQQNLANIETEFFKEHGIDAVTIDGQDIYLSPVKRYGGYLRELYNSEQRPVGIGPPIQTKKLLPFKLARIEKEKVSIDKFTRRYLRGDIDDVGSFGTKFYNKSPIEFDEIGKHSSRQQQKVILIEGAPGVGKTTFSWEFCRKWVRGEILQDHSILLLCPLRDNNLQEAKTLSDLFYHPNPELRQAIVQEVSSNQGLGVAIWLEAWDELKHHPREIASVFLDLTHGRILPLATVFVTSRPWATEHLRWNCERISEHVEILASAKDQIDHYINKAKGKAQPGLFADKFTHYLSSNPVIKAAMYTPVTAKMSAEVFTRSQHTKSPPTTMTELFTVFTLNTVLDYLSRDIVHHKQMLKVTTFNELPQDVYKQFQGLCRMAYEGLVNRQQLVFSVSHLPTEFAPLGLIQEVPQLYAEGKASTYHFIHLTLQEYLAAVHISQLPTHEQTRLIQEHLHNGHFKMTIRFLAGLTKLANILPDVSRGLSDNTKLTYFHFLFEAKDISLTTRTLGLDEMFVRPFYSWTPLDYYVTGHAISHSNCSWKLDFSRSSIDDEKFELFCQGCAAPGGNGCRGHLSYAYFSSNGITSKSMQSFVKIPSQILQNLKELELFNNKLDGRACDLLAMTVPSMSSLEDLLLGSNPIRSCGMVKVMKALRACKVKRLLLYSTEIGVPDCKALCELLKCTSSLQDLDIQMNNLSSESVASIMTGLSHNSSLMSLNISNSCFDVTNVDNLASILSNPYSMSTLTSLWIDNCHICEQGAGALAAAFYKNSTLKYLRMDGNPIGVKGAFLMSEMLQYNTSLESLGLNDNSVREEGVHHLINSLKHNQTLEILWLPIKYKSENSDRRIDWR